ncbi:MAG: hypothetical protein IIC40_05110 [Candidatus Marinimicrobia bacterium]|nr:hypothetical protein [Candidatus Neomarinimicrobiota bacterium]
MENKINNLTSIHHLYIFLPLMDALTTFRNFYAYWWYYNRAEGVLM